MITLETLETIELQETHVKKHKTSFSIIKEIAIFGGIMAITAIAGIVFTNLHLFQSAIMEDILGIKDKAPAIIASTSSSVINSMTAIVEPETDNHFYLDTKDTLKNQIASNSLIFNTLPPDNRIIIEDLGIDAPIVDLNYFTPEKLEKGDFHQELERGVVRYPNTGNPQRGNMLIFGHTSDYWWNNNEFGQIFRNIPKLENGHIVKIIWNNQVYRYRIVAKEVVKPKNVSTVYANYHSEDKNYISLVGCYPIGTADSRIVVIGEQIIDDANNSQEVIKLTYK